MEARKSSGPVALSVAVERVAGQARRCLAADRDKVDPRDVRVLCELALKAEALAGASVRRLPLTPRELEIVELIAAGETNCRIAQRLAISPSTVKSHVSQILRKLRVPNRAAIVGLAFDDGAATSAASPLPAPGHSPPEQLAT